MIDQLTDFPEYRDILLSDPSFYSLFIVAVFFLCGSAAAVSGKTKIIGKLFTIVLLFGSSAGFLFIVWRLTDLLEDTRLHERALRCTEDASCFLFSPIANANESTFTSFVESMSFDDCNRTSSEQFTGRASRDLLVFISTGDADVEHLLNCRNLSNNSLCPETTKVVNGRSLTVLSCKPVRDGARKRTFVGEVALD